MGKFYPNAAHLLRFPISRYVPFGRLFNVCTYLRRPQGASMHPAILVRGNILSEFASQLWHFKRWPVIDSPPGNILPSPAGRVHYIAKAATQGCLPYLTCKNGSWHLHRQMFQDHTILCESEIPLICRTGHHLRSLSMFRPRNGTCMNSRSDHKFPFDFSSPSFGFEWPPPRSGRFDLGLRSVVENAGGRQ